LLLEVVIFLGSNIVLKVSLVEVAEERHIDVTHVFRVAGNVFAENYLTVVGGEGFGKTKHEHGDCVSLALGKGYA
jgi:hypothetical protein